MLSLALLVACDERSHPAGVEAVDAGVRIVGVEAYQGVSVAVVSDGE